MSTGGVGFTAGAAGGGLHSTARGCGRGILVAPLCRRGSSMPTTVVTPCRRQWPTPREVFGKTAASGGLHNIARGWGGGHFNGNFMPTGELHADGEASCRR